MMRNVDNGFCRTKDCIGGHSLVGCLSNSPLVSTLTLLKGFAMVTLSNPVDSLTIHDWPLGRDYTTQCVFEVEYRKGKGQRVSRVTLNKYGVACKPKKTVYSPFWCIAEGDDEKTYLLSYTTYGQFVLLPGTLQGGMYFYPESSPETFEHYKEVMRQAIADRKAVNS